ncbi:hypothetical protein [Wukongibacter baidiensis]
MRNPERIDSILELVKQIWKREPDTRFLQLISNLEVKYSRENNNYGKKELYFKENGHEFEYNTVDLFHLEDDEFKEFLISKLTNSEGE